MFGVFVQALHKDITGILAISIPLKNGKKMERD
jgi:hypothetical protein